jgi:peptidoglycan/LPS O-acetylase OafA/YrhL
MTERERLPELDGIRGMAILAVFLYHYVNGSEHGFFAYVGQLFRLGWSGVDLFFVLSGFLIGGILLDSRSSPNYFRTFYIRRVHRILPIYYVWVTLFGIAGYLGARWHPDVFVISVPLAAYFLFLQNMIFTPLSTYTLFAIGNTWSLAVEEQFYLIAPLVVRSISVRRLTWLLLACIAAAPILRAIVFARFDHGARAIYWLMPCRADSLAMGMLAAIAWRSNVRLWLARHTALLKVTVGVLGVCVLALVKWVPSPQTVFQAAYEYSLIGVAGVSLLLLSLTVRDGIVARVTRWSFLREWGRISYGLYLIHNGILRMAHYLILHNRPTIANVRGLLVTLFAAGLSWTVAELSWNYFEKPLVDRGHRLSRGDATPALTLAKQPIDA